MLINYENLDTTTSRALAQHCVFLPHFISSQDAAQEKQYFQRISTCDLPFIHTGSIRLENF